MKKQHNQTQVFVIVALSVLIFSGCSSAPTAVPTATPAPTATPDPKLALVGSWTSTVTKEDIQRVMPAFKAEFLCENTGTFIWNFKADGTFVIDQTALPDCPASTGAHVEDKWTLDGNLLTLAKDTPDQEVYEWYVSGDSLTFTAKSGDCIPCIAVNTANPWKRMK